MALPDLSTFALRILPVSDSVINISEFSSPPKARFVVVIPVELLTRNVGSPVSEKPQTQPFPACATQMPPNVSNAMPSGPDKRYAKLRRLYPDLLGSVFHSTRKWFITQCERTGTPEHFTASLVGHHSARSANKLTYGL